MTIQRSETFQRSDASRPNHVGLKPKRFLTQMLIELLVYYSESRTPDIITEGTTTLIGLGRGSALATSLLGLLATGLEGAGRGLAALGSDLLLEDNSVSDLDRKS